MSSLPDIREYVEKVRERDRDLAEERKVQREREGDNQSELSLPLSVCRERREKDKRWDRNRTTSSGRLTYDG